MLPYAKSITRNVSPEKKTSPRFSLSTVYDPENPPPPKPPYRYKMRYMTFSSQNARHKIFSTSR